MDEIHLLLQKLGEIPDPAAADDGIRVFELAPGEDPNEVMDRIKRLWRRENELKSNIPETPKPETPTEEKEQVIPGESVTRFGRHRQRVEVWPPRPKKPVDALTKMLNETEATESKKIASDIDAGQETESGESWDPQKRVSSDAEPILAVAQDDSGTPAPNAVPPIRFSTTPDGHLIISSDDKAALQDMEDLMQHVVKPAPKYKVFHLKYATPSWVTINLEEYFQADEDSESRYRYDPYWGFMPSSGRSNQSNSLGRRRQPQFIYDNFTSTILVRDADRRQLQTIADLIEIYDVPEPADTRAMRVTKVFRLQNSKADAVAQAVKDVFRDLLSANDKALEKKDGEKTQTRVYSYFGDDSGGDDDTPIRFKGLLSIGIDPNSDTLVVSSTASLMDTVSELVLELDRAAETSSTVHVLKVDPTVDISLLQEKLAKALQAASPEQKGKSPGKNGQQGGVPVGAQPGR